MTAHAVRQGIGIGREMTARAVGVDELSDTRRLALLAFQVVLEVCFPRVGLDRNMQSRKDTFVETIATRQLNVHETEEFTGSSTLDDAVIIGRRDKHRLANSHESKFARGDSSELGWIIHCPHTDNQPLATHQTRNRGRGADGARIRQGDSGTLIILSRKFALLCPSDNALIGVNKLREGQGISIVDNRNNQTAFATVLDIDRQAKSHVCQFFNRGFTVLKNIANIQLWHLGKRLNDGIPNEMRERNLAANSALQVRVHNRAVLNQDLCGNLALRSRSRDAQ